MKASLPSSPTEWQSAVDGAMGDLLLARACYYGLVLTIPWMGKQRGFEPAFDSPGRFVIAIIRKEREHLRKLLMIGLADHD